MSSLFTVRRVWHRLTLAVLLLSVVACSRSADAQRSPADWKVNSINAWVQDKYVLAVPHPSFGQVTIYAGNLVTDDADKRALFVDVGFQSVGPQTDSVTAWKTALQAAKIPDAKIPIISESQFRFFDSAKVHLVLNGAAQEVKTVSTLAEANILVISDLAAVGESPSPKGWTGSFLIGPLDRFLGLVKQAQEVRLTLIFNVPANFDRQAAKLDFYGQTLPLPPGDKPNEASIAVVWHSEMWKK